MKKRMDLRFTPHDQRPRSTPEPGQSSSPAERQAEVTVSVAMVHPGSGLRSDNTRENGVCEGRRGDATPSMTFRPITNSPSNGSDERELNGRPSSAPARTPTSVGVSMMDVTPSPRPRVTRPLGAIQALSTHSNMADTSASPQPMFMAPADEHDNSRDNSPNDSFSHAADGANENKTLKCNICGYSTEEKCQLRRHKRGHHQRTNPTSMLHCDKCHFSTLTPRKMREHYSRLHNEDIGGGNGGGGASYISASMHMRTSTFNPSNLNHRGMDGAGYILDMNGSRALHNYRLSQPRGTLQFDPGDEPSESIILPSCTNNTGTFPPTPVFPASFRFGSSSSTERRVMVSATADNNHHHHHHLAGTSTNSLSSLMTNMLTHRIPATSTITSCEYPARPANPHRPDLNNPSPISRGQFSGPSSSTFRGLCQSPPVASSSPPSSGRHCHFVSLTHGEGVKVKIEPIDCDGVSDVSSSGVPGFLFERDRGGGGGEGGRSGVDHPDVSASHLYSEPRVAGGSQVGSGGGAGGYLRPMYRGATSTPSSRCLDQSDEIAPSATTTNDISRVSQSSEAAVVSSRLCPPRPGSAGESQHQQQQRGGGGGASSGVGCGRRGNIGVGGEGDHSLGQQLLFSVKSETSSVGVQCSGPSGLKAESSTVTVAAAEHSTECRQRPLPSRHLLIERGVQCELLSSSSPPRRVTSRTLSTDSEQQSVSGSDCRCSHCGITFEDEVLFSIHIGCHSHTDPFVCNVCGKKYHNKYGFYSHIVRGHHF